MKPAKGDARRVRSLIKAECANFRPDGTCLGAPMIVPHLVEGQPPFDQYAEARRQRTPAARTPYHRPHCGQCHWPLV